LALTISSHCSVAAEVNSNDPMKNTASSTDGRCGQVRVAVTPGRPGGSRQFIAAARAAHHPDRVKRPAFTRLE